MERYYIFKDGRMVGADPTREEAVEHIRRLQKREAHYMLKSEFSIIKGEQEFIHYK